MALRLQTRCAIAAAFVIAFAHPIDLESCGPFIPAAVFVRLAIPENQEAFFKGQLGVLQPDYWRRYLAVAYRIMSGLPVPALPTLPKLAAITPPASPPPSAVDRWIAARRPLSKIAIDIIDTDRQDANFSSYVNCNDDAFTTAVTTLNDRIRSAGAQSLEVHDWVISQDAVFSNCGHDGVMPQPAPPGSGARIRTDRAYQIAAAHFYSGDYDGAKSLFQEIALDPDSPWRTLAPYLAARADVRQGDLQTAETDLKGIVADPKLIAIHPQADALLELVLGRIDPSRALTACAKYLLSPDSTTLERDLESFTFLYDKIEDNPNNTHAKPDTTDDLIAWIEIMQRRGTEDQAIEHWQQHHALPWLIASLANASKTTAQTPELITAALAVPATSPAWATAHYHAIRLLLDTGQIEPARKALDDVRPQMSSLSRSSQNAFSAQMTQTATTLNAFLASAVRPLSATVSDYYADDLTPEEQSLRLLGVDAAGAFNLEMPLELWLQSALTTRIPTGPRKHIAQTGFVRALLLKNPTASAFAQLVAQLSPDDAAGMRRFIAATQPDDRFYEGLFWLLHRPAASPNVRGGLLRSEKDQAIDDYRDNWWGPHSDAPAPPVTFLTPVERKQGLDEAKQVAAAGSARVFLAAAVLAWAHSRPDDPRLPEALAMTVRMSHYSPEDSAADANVERAFNLLHQRFPQTTWAKQTPYWYK